MTILNSKKTVAQIRLKSSSRVIVEQQTVQRDSRRQQEVMVQEKQQPNQAKQKESIINQNKKIRTHAQKHSFHSGISRRDYLPLNKIFCLCLIKIKHIMATQMVMIIIYESRCSLLFHFVLSYTLRSLKFDRIDDAYGIYSHAIQSIFSEIKFTKKYY